MMIYEHEAATLLIWIGILCAAGAALFSYLFFIRHSALKYAMAGTRLLFLLLLAWCLLLPGRRDVLTETQRPRFVVMLDQSESMAQAPADDLPTRWDAAMQVLQQSWVDTVSSACELETYTFATETSAEMDIETLRQQAPNGASSLLRDALKRVSSRYAGQAVKGVLLLSDGIDTREAFDDWAADPRNIPIYTVRLEPDTQWQASPDVRIDTVSTPKRVTVDWKTEFKAVVSGEGLAGQPVTVQLYKDNTLQEELPLVLPDGSGGRNVAFELEHPDIGVFTYRVAVPHLPEEANTNDNAYAVSVQVITARNQLLYVEGPPRWESKYLGRALKANRDMTPLVFLRGPGGRFITIGQAGDMTPEMRDDQLGMFKIVIVGNLDAEELGNTRAENLVRFVEDGGSLVLLGGSKAWGKDGFAATPLRKLLPTHLTGEDTVEGEYDVQLTDTGRAHPAFAGDPELWDIIPPVLSVFPTADLAPGARTLVEANTPNGLQPLLVSLRYGQGKVAAVFTDSLWRWQLTPDTRTNQPYRRFWDQLIAWLIPEEQALDLNPLDVFVDVEQLYLGEDVTVTARGNKADTIGDTLPVRCVITGPDDRAVPFDMRSRFVPTASGKSVPGRAYTYTAMQPGLHVVTAEARIDGEDVTAAPVSFFVKPFTPESMPRPARTDVLTTISRSSKGRYFDTADALNTRLNTLDFRGTDEEIAEYSSLWQLWLILGCLIGLLTLEWIFRKSANLP